jgi:DNA-directed RNA polymerase subunit K/omega
MIYPQLEELTQHGKYNRYTLVVATAKAARILTDEYVLQRDNAEKMSAAKDADKTIPPMTKKEREIRDEKAVKNAVNRLAQGDYVIVVPDDLFTPENVNFVDSMLDDDDLDTNPFIVE